MGKKTERDIARAKEKMAVAHEKKLEAIDRVFARVKNAETTSYEKRIRMLEMAGQRIAAAKPAAKAAEAAVADKLSDVSEAAGKVRVKTTKRMRQQPWIVALAASALFLALGVSVGRRYFSAG